jgi:hypothetical protein
VSGPSFLAVVPPITAHGFVDELANYGDAYFSRFQVKYRRRREGNTDCECPLHNLYPDHLCNYIPDYTPKRLVTQVKNK